MDSTPITLSSRSISTTGGRSKRAAVSEEPGKKPKKPNSEIRKQQNRIASRNYREKRKRKLQYLQQLVNDDSDGHQDSEPSPRQHEVYSRSLSADYEVAGSSLSPYTSSSNLAFGSVGASTAVVTQAILAATTASFGAHQLSAEQTYSSYPPDWNAPVYSPPPPANIPWNMPPVWMSSLEYSAQASTVRPSMYRYNTHPAHSSFQQAHTSSHSSPNLPRESLANAGLYGYDANYAPQSHGDGNFNVSQPTSYESYYQGHRPAPN
ncbi:hypothetical protein G6011_06034 [Alternaria panax]|uniref:BZIP domain-containing protein n=1 Tax=Alternaria panax TaxID=48097 RepID=A0AAD4FI73_9PLEO|nr:hypothetical protein G6011_06034 [Alternaria panax]